MEVSWSLVDAIEKLGMPQSKDPAGHASHRPCVLSATYTPASDEEDVSQTPLASYPTHVPFRLKRGDAQRRQSPGLGPKQVVHAGEQVLHWLPSQYCPSLHLVEVHRPLTSSRPVSQLVAAVRDVHVVAPRAQARQLLLLSR